MGKRNSKGFTFIEILIALLVLTVAVAAVFEAHRQLNRFSEINRQQNTALDHLQSMMEMIQAQAFANLATNFPAGVANKGSAPSYNDIVGGLTLTNEQITVTYPTATAILREVVVTVQWNGPEGRLFTRSLSTMRVE